MVDKVMIGDGAHEAITVLFTVSSEGSNQFDWDPQFRAALRPEVWIEMTMKAYSLFLEESGYDVTDSMNKHLQHLFHYAQ